MKRININDASRFEFQRLKYVRSKHARGQNIWKIQNQNEQRKKAKPRQGIRFQCILYLNYKTSNIHTINIRIFMSVLRISEEIIDDLVKSGVQFLSNWKVFMHDRLDQIKFAIIYSSSTHELVVAKNNLCTLLTSVSGIEDWCDFFLGDKCFWPSLRSSDVQYFSTLIALFVERQTDRKTYQRWCRGGARILGHPFVGKKIVI